MQVSISSRDELERAAGYFQNNNGGVLLTLWVSDDLDDGYVERLTEALGFAENIYHLNVDAKLLTGDSMAVDSFCAAIGMLDGLQQLRVWRAYTVETEEDGRARVRVRNISRLIRSSAEVLTSMEFNCKIDIDGSVDDFVEFGAVLSECKQLTWFDFSRGIGIAGGKGTFATVNPVLDAINSLPKLVLQHPHSVLGPSVECWIPDSSVVNRCSAEMTLPLAQLFRHPTVQNLYINNHSKLAAIACTIFHHNNALPPIANFSTEWGQVDMQQVGEILKHSTSLVSLELGTEGNAREDEENFLPLVEALEKNVSLRKLEINGMVSAVCLETMTKKLETKNFTITRLREIIWRRTYPDRSKRELQCLARISLFEKLNRQGRAQVFRKKSGEVTREDWIWRLHRSRNDLDCLFYYLSMNPSLCNKCGDKGWPNHNEASIATRTRKRRKITGAS